MLRIRKGMLCYGREERHREGGDNGRSAKKNPWILRLSVQEPQSNQENEVPFRGDSCHHLESNPWNAGPGLAWLSGKSPHCKGSSATASDSFVRAGSVTPWRSSSLAPLPAEEPGQQQQEGLGLSGAGAWLCPGW